MKKTRNILIILAVIELFLGKSDTFIVADTINSEYVKNMKQDILVMMMAYPEYITDVYKAQDQKVYIVVKSGAKILYDDFKVKNKSYKESSSDIQDMLEQIYPLEDISDLMEKDFDPGRIRNYEILNYVYGESAQNIRSNLTKVNGFGNFEFNKNNKAAQFLSSAMKEIQGAVNKNSKLAGFVYPISGTFNYRKISGTDRLSPHAYGIAIDLKSDKKDYWKWASFEEGQKRLNSYPREIVKAFENNYFIWGGKWNHFDILHFEYRPELIIKAKYFKDSSKTLENWYGDVNIEDETIKKYIDTIEEVLR